MIKEVTPQIAALYLGERCDIEWMQPDYDLYTQTGDVWTDLTIEQIKVDFVSSGCAKIVPYLRRLSSITDEEALDLYNIKFGESVVRNWPSALHWWHDLNGDELWVREAQIGNPRIWLYLLSKGFDLFGLIDAGLAKEVQYRPDFCHKKTSRKGR